MNGGKPYLRLRKPLDVALSPAVWPAGIAPLGLSEIDPKAAHQVLESAFPRLVARFADWHGNLVHDEEYDPALCIAAVNGKGEVVGFAQSWTSNFIKDLAVAPAWRRKGIGEALMLHTFAVFVARGAPHVDLKVKVAEADPRRLYARLGMVEVA